MKIAVVFCFVLTTLFGSLLAAICPPEWQRFGESCYFMIAKKITWFDANRTCVELRATLAVPNSMSEHVYIWERYKEMFGVNIHLWIRCNDLEVEGKWQHCPLRGDSTGFENWWENQPDGANGAHCATMSNGNGSQWDDHPCSIYHSAVCELPVSSSQRFCLQTGNDGRLNYHSLVGHVLKELRADGVVSCEKACRSEPRCRSFNLLMEQGRRRMVCQLNNATRQDAREGDIETQGNCFLFDLAVCELPVSSTQKFCPQTDPNNCVESCCLIGRVIKELRADGVLSCGKASRSQLQCRSLILLWSKAHG